jgi:DnaJ-class molecular chaperone|tara:strand:+ start:537 stop:734 length:198 start_codon:yes stop_codon:yes gene_type:complete
MAKLKKARVTIHICPTCKGNGFVKVASLERDESTVHQCWDCDSEGEFYETVDNDLIDDGPSNKLH